MTAKPPEPDGIWRGIRIGAGINAGALLVGIVTIPLIVGVFVVELFSLLQLAWLIPMYLRHRGRGETETAKGLAVAAGLTVLLSAGCWGAMLTSNWKM
jgi:hypothetical protein